MIANVLEVDAVKIDIGAPNFDYGIDGIYALPFVPMRGGNICKICLQLIVKVLLNLIDQFKAVGPEVHKIPINLNADSDQNGQRNEVNDSLIT